LPAPEDDVIEIDELCVRKSPSLWLWVAVSRRIGQVLGFAFGSRDRHTLALCWEDVPQDYRNKRVATDALETYRHFFDEVQHRPVEKGSGETSIVESLNTKWRQRQSGLVRRSCGVSQRIETDLIERFFLLVEQHNAHSQRQWERHQKTTHSDQ
jgi:IS1 family transposase